MMNGIVDYARPYRSNLAQAVEFPMNHIVSAGIDNRFSQIKLDKPFNVQVISIDKNLGTKPSNKNSDIFQSEFTINRITFPHCFPQSKATSGQNVTIDIDGLKPNSGIHGLIGPTAVFHGNTDKNGNATIQFPVPSNTTASLHLVTIGIDKTALTADCELDVTTGGKTG